MRIMNNTGLQFAHGGENSGLTSSFSAVLQEIFQQAQTEIEARNRNVDSKLGTMLRQCSESSQAPLMNSAYTCQPQSSFSTPRYEAQGDPALSFISGFLADDEEALNSTSFLSPEDFIAFQAKATEVAALLQEDSPCLPLRIDSGPPASPDSSLTSASEDSYPETPSNQLSYLDGEDSFSLGSFAEASINESLLSSLRGPIPKPLMNFSGPYAFETQSADCLYNLQQTQTVKEGSRDDIGIRSHSKAQKSPTKKTEKGLKPRRERSMPRKKGGGKAKSGKDGEQELVDINDLLMQCAKAVGVNNTKRAVELLSKVKQHCSPHGNGAERLAYYFAEAMDARFSGTGWPLYLGVLRRRPSPAEILRATYLYMTTCPFVKAYHYFINQNIINAAKKASKLHILELQVDGCQYPSLFKSLAERSGGPPEVHVIGLRFPHYSMLPARTDVVLEAVQKTGQHLADCAAAYGVPFQYTPWAGIREHLCMQDFVSPYRSVDEVLVILSTSLLRYVMDETLDSSVLRSKLLKQGRDINPEVYVQGIVTGSYSTPFFTRRFREALFHFESVFDMLDNFIDSRESTDRLIFESEILGKAILHIVACEGTEVIERIDKYKHWQAVTEEVGFQQVSLDEKIKGDVQYMLKSCHKEYTVAEDSQYLLMGWKGRMLHAMSTWKATPEERF